MKKFLIFIIKIYKKTLSPFLDVIGIKCKYYPTCSEYTKQAIEKYGVIKGCFLGIKRILKCNPFSKGGYDPLKIKLKGIEKMGFISELFGYVLNALYNLISNYGIAIIIFSVLLRIILIPITIKQQKTIQKSNKMQQAMKEIQAKYKNNPEKLNQETIDLYKREGFSPFSGCLSAILQLVIILSVFWLVSQPLTYMKKVQNSEIFNEYKTKIEENTSTRSTYKEIAIINAVESDYQDINERLNNENVENREELENKKAQLEELRINMEFLGLDLSKVPTQSLNDWKVYVIPILYVITSFISIKITTKTQNMQNKDKEKSEELESMEQMNKSMSYMMPIMSISIAAIAPLGLALYWLISNILIIIERLIINKFMSSKEEDENV